MTSVNWNFSFGSGPTTSWRRHTTEYTASSASTTTIINVVTSTATLITSTMTSTAPAPTVTMVSHSGLSPAATIGIIVGVIVGACIFLGALFMFCWKRKTRKLADRESRAPPPPPLPPMGAILSPPPHHERHSKRLEAGSNQRPPSNARITSQPSVWPENAHPHPDEVGVAIVPDEQHGFLNWKKNRRPSTRSYLSISAPIPIQRNSISETFQERFFKEPKPKTPVGQDDRHPSDATTIRTSGNPPTPNRTALNLLRLYSSSTSRKSSVEDDEEDKERLIADPPPVPTFTAVEVPLQPVTAKLSADDAAQLSLEAGIRTNISKATSRYPLTPNYEASTVDYWSATPLPSIPERHHELTPRLGQDARAQNPTGSATNELRRKPVPASPKPRFQQQQQQQQQSPPPPYPEIPDRSSSRQSARSYTRQPVVEDWPSQDGVRRTTQVGWDEIFQAAALPENRAEYASATSPMRNLTYPSVQTSIRARTDPSPTASQAPPAGSFPRKPLPAMAQAANLSEDPLEGPSNYRGARRLSQRTNRMSPPSTSSDALRLNTTHRYKPSRVTLTPNKTPTGDLVLTVDM